MSKKIINFIKIILLIVLVSIIGFNYWNIRDAYLNYRLQHLKQRYERLENKQRIIHQKAELIRIKLAQPVASYTKAYEIKYENNMINLVNNAMKLPVDTGLVLYLAGKCSRYGSGNIVAKCFKFGMGIMNAESGLGRKAYCNNLFGLIRKGKIMCFKSKYDSIDYWVDKYYKYWYKHNKTSEFLTKSLYCVSGCKNRVSNVNYVLNVLNGRK